MANWARNCSFDSPGQVRIKESPLCPAVIPAAGLELSTLHLPVCAAAIPVSKVKLSIIPRSCIGAFLLKLLKIIQIRLIWLLPVAAGSLMALQ